MRTGMKSKCSAHLEVDQQLGVLRCDVPYLDNLRAWTLLRHNRRSWSEALTKMPMWHPSSHVQPALLMTWPCQAMQQVRKACAGRPQQARAGQHWRQETHSRPERLRQQLPGAALHVVLLPCQAAQPQP